MSNPTPNDRPDHSEGGDPPESNRQPTADPETESAAPATSDDGTAAESAEDRPSEDASGAEAVAEASGQPDDAPKPAEDGVPMAVQDSAGDGSRADAPTGDTDAAAAVAADPAAAAADGSEVVSGDNSDAAAAAGVGGGHELAETNDTDVPAPDDESDGQPSPDGTDPQPEVVADSSAPEPAATELPASDDASDEPPSTDTADPEPESAADAGNSTSAPSEPREVHESFTVASAEQDAELGTSSIPVIPPVVAANPAAAAGTTPSVPAGGPAVAPADTAPTDAPAATISASVLASAGAAAAVATPPNDGAAPRPATPPPVTPVFVTAPTPPRIRGNRGFGILIAVLAALGFAVLYAAVSWGIFVIAKPSGATAELESYLASIAFWVPVVATFVALVILIVIVNRSGWWAYVIFGLLVGAAVYFAYIGGALLQVQAWTLTYQQASTLIGHLWSNPLTIAAAVVAREVTIWFGAWIAAHGRKVRARNLDAKREYDRMLAAGPEAAVASGSGVPAPVATSPDGSASGAAPVANPATAPDSAPNPAPEADA